MSSIVIKEMKTDKIEIKYEMTLDPFLFLQLFIIVSHSRNIFDPNCFTLQQTTKDRYRFQVVDPHSELQIYP